MAGAVLGDRTGYSQRGRGRQVPPDRGGPWIRNFHPGLTSLDGVYSHPNGNHILVGSGGQGYIVDPETKALVQLIGGALESVHVYADYDLLVLDHQGLAFEAIGRSGHGVAHPPSFVGRVS